jgi:tetratricopeptide (TPR) repeat protein
LAITTILSADRSKYFIIDPMCTPLRWYSGSAYYNMGNQPMAYADFEKSFNINPNHIHVLNNLGTAYEINGEHEKAITMYKRASEISPAFDEAKLNLVATYFNSGNKNEAFKTFSSIPYDTLNDKYLQILPLVVSAKLKIISDTIRCIPLKMQVEAINNTPEWSKSLFIKSKQNKVSFDKQILTDAIFVLDSVEKSNNFVYINTIIDKFKII